LAQPLLQLRLVLRITRVDADGGAFVRLEGRLVGPWVSELRSFIVSLANGAERCLDLAGLEFVDRGGAELLIELRAAGAEIVAARPYVADLLEAATRGQRDRSQETR
jgi:hypothetical protein